MHIIYIRIGQISKNINIDMCGGESSTHAIYRKMRYQNDINDNDIDKRFKQLSLEKVFLN